MEPGSQFQRKSAGAQAERTLRCGRGSLLARRVALGVEIKCRRCKRCVVVPLDANGAAQINM